MATWTSSCVVPFGLWLLLAACDGDKGARNARELSTENGDGDQEDSGSGQDGAGDGDHPGDGDASGDGDDALDGGQGDSESDADTSPDAGDRDAGEPPFMPRPRPIEGGDVPGPITGANPPFVIKPFDAEEHGYVQEEFFLQGWATHYEPEGELGLDGAWKAVPEGQAPYRTRLLVRRPAEAKDFNGSVFVEWLNTTGSLDAEIGWALNWEELVRGGYGYVGVSVQASGVSTLKGVDAERYASLQHPGDQYSYDIYAQAGAAIAWPGSVKPMGELQVRRLIAYGESQSAMRMITYVNAVQPLSHVFDGVIIHSRAGWGAPVGTESDSLLGNGMPVRVRLDSAVRVLQFFTESELFLALGPAFQARQPDNDHLRTWEVSGTAHADAHLLGEGTDLCGPINNGPQHIVIKAALRAMHTWLKDGIEPPHGPPIAVTAANDAIARDEHGNALESVRTPAVDVPISKLSGEAPPLSPQCLLFGHTVAFTPEKLLALYPTHAAYVEQVVDAAENARKARFILPEEVDLLVEAAKAADVP